MQQGAELCRFQAWISLMSVLRVSILWWRRIHPCRNLYGSTVLLGRTSKELCASHWRPSRLQGAVWTMSESASSDGTLLACASTTSHKLHTVMPVLPNILLSDILNRSFHMASSSCTCAMTQPQPSLTDVCNPKLLFDGCLSLQWATWVPIHASQLDDFYSTVTDLLFWGRDLPDACWNLASCLIPHSLIPQCVAWWKLDSGHSQQREGMHLLCPSWQAGFCQEISGSCSECVLHYQACQLAR